MAVGTDMGAHPALALLAGAVEDVRKAVALLSADEVWTAGNGDPIAVLRTSERLAGAVEAARLSALREADVRGVAAADGQASTAQWLAKTLTLHPGEAKARVRSADVLSRKATTAGAALAAGKINPSQARALAAGLGRIESLASAEEFAEAEAFLLREGIGLHAGHITRLARHIESVLDPDGSDPGNCDPDGDGPGPEPKARRKRDLTITDLGGGVHRIKGFLTDEAAALLKAALDPLAAPRPAVDGVKDTRTPGQRNHDALAEVLTQFLRFGDLGTAHGVRPHLHITATVEAYRGDPGHPYARTATGEDLDLKTLQRLACDAGITPILASTLGEPLAVGRESRTATPAQWKALVARDIGCIGEGCTRPASWCEAHHFPPWEDGGQTDLDKMALLCTHEHYLVHHDGWEVRMAADGHPEMIPPPWVDPDQRPRRNAHWKLIRDGLKTDPPEREDPDRGP